MNAAAPAASNMSATAAHKSGSLEDVVFFGSGAAPFCEPGRGLATCDAERMNFGSADAGACGTTILWKQVGHSICEPVVVESAVMCWPHTGHANLNSLMALG